MKHLAICILLASPAIAQSYDVPLKPYVGGRVVTHVLKETVFQPFSRPRGEISYTYQWPGVYFEGRFTGASVDVKVDDDQDNLYLYVDGVHKLTLTRPGRATIALKDLGTGTHDVRLEKSSETQTSTGTFDGFYVSSTSDALPPPHYDRRIEFIGDSYTVGYGDTSRGQVCTADDVRDTTDTAQAFAPLTAKYFHAAYRIMADSGHGVVRNYGGSEPGETVPLLYKYTLFDKSAGVPDDGWTPDVVVIGLGTNDFSTPLGPGERWQTRDELRADFVRTYADFVESLRAKWPSTHFILMASTAFDGEIIDAVDAVASALRKAGETDVELLPFGGLDWQACDSHPSLKDHRILAQLLIERIARLPKFAPVTVGTALPAGRLLTVAASDK
jgi:lysophospholipase L1-like esterase